MPPVGAELRREHAGRRASPAQLRQDDGAGAVAEQQVPRPRQSRMREKVSAPITSAVRTWPVRMKPSAVASA